jgi:curved DNA-binding protein CbpA
MVLRNYYLVLGLEDYSNIEVVKKRYRKLAKLYHPDKNPNDPKALQKFQNIAEAYEVLSDKNHKQRLDDLLMGKAISAKSKSPEQRIAEAKRRAHALKVNSIEMRFMAYKNSGLNVRRRIFLAYFLMLTIFFLFVFNYFPNLERRFTIVFLAILGLVYASLVYLFVDSYYLNKAYKARHRPIELMNLLKKSSYVFLALFFGSPILGALTAHLRKSVLLNYEQRITKPLEISDARNGEKWRIKFYANYELYSCMVSVDGLEFVNKKDLRIAYYPNDPRLCELIRIDK